MTDRGRGRDEVGARARRLSKTSACRAPTRNVVRRKALTAHSGSLKKTRRSTPSTPDTTRRAARRGQGRAVVGRPTSGVMSASDVVSLGDVELAVAGDGVASPAVGKTTIGDDVATDGGLVDPRLAAVNTAASAASTPRVGGARCSWAPPPRPSLASSPPSVPRARALFSPRPARWAARRISRASSRRAARRRTNSSTRSARPCRTGSAPSCSARRWR